jgi:hypothetical protein
MLEETLKNQQMTIQEQQKVIEELKKQVKSVKPSEVGKTDQAGSEPQTPKPGVPLGSVMTNPYISLVLNTFAYDSNLSEDQLESKGIPAYTTEGIDRRKGINLESAELFLFGPVDPYFNLYATIPVTEDGAELEEAYFVTTSLPKGHQIKGGKFKSGFGRLNAMHPHAWDFVDAPLPYRAFIGEEGIIEKGLQYTYLLPLPFYTLLGIELLEGENSPLLDPDPSGFLNAYSLFAKASLDLTDSSTLLFGPSVIWGETKTDTVQADSEFTGDSLLAGFEMTYKWKPSRAQSLTLQSEYLLRDSYGDLTDTALGTLERLDRRQDGWYLQGVYQWNRWRFGARYDVLGLFEDDYVLAGAEQDFGKRPWRGTGMIEFNPTEFSRLRLQYTYDESARDGVDNNEIFLQLILGIGAHAAHPF